MTRGLPRTNFHSSTLIRSLADLALVDVPEPETAFAEKLGLWIHFTDAIALSAVHGEAPASQAGMPSAAPADAAHAAATEFERVRSTMTESITRSCTFQAGRTHIRLPMPEIALPLDLAAAYAPYHRFYAAHQRDMELGLQPLRSHVRDALANASPRLRKLAELDAVLEKVLREREGKLLGRVPALLKKRFEQLFSEHRQLLAETGQPDKPAAWTKRGGWLARFCSDMQSLLLAELELRLQATQGLIDAIKQNTQ